MQRPTTSPPRWVPPFTPSPPCVPTMESDTSVSRHRPAHTGASVQPHVSYPGNSYTSPRSAGRGGVYQSHSPGSSSLATSRTSRLGTPLSSVGVGYPESAQRTFPNDARYVPQQGNAAAQQHGRSHPHSHATMSDLHPGHAQLVGASDGRFYPMNRETNTPGCDMYRSIPRGMPEKAPRTAETNNRSRQYQLEAPPGLYREHSRIRSPTTASMPDYRPLGGAAFPYQTTSSTEVRISSPSTSSSTRASSLPPVVLSNGISSHRTSSLDSAVSFAASNVSPHKVSNTRSTPSIPEFDSPSPSPGLHHWYSSQAM